MQHEHHLLLHLAETGGWPDELGPEAVPPWRMRERMKTSSLVLVLALNIGVDPPDVIKPSPCARLECWVDPQVGQKAIEAVAKALQAQYEQWQPRARVRACLDPTAEEVRKWCVSLRRASPGRDERLLLHFNGHGVPRPTVNGEVWLFNRSFTQYNPVSVYDLQVQEGTFGISPALNTHQHSFNGKSWLRMNRCRGTITRCNPSLSRVGVRVRVGV